MSAGGSGEPGPQEAAEQGLQGASPFHIQPAAMPQLVTTASGQLPGVGSASAGGLPAAAGLDPAFFHTYLSAGSSGGSASLGATYTLSLQDQQALAAAGHQPLYVEMGPAGNPIALPLLPQQFQAQAAAAQQQQQQQATSSGQTAARGAAKAKPRAKRPYKPPQQVAQERKLKEEANEYIRRLEQQLGKARSELERLNRETTTLQRKAVVLTKHTSFRRCAAGMLQELQDSMTMGQPLDGMDCSQRVLDAAEKGLPEPSVLEYLRQMTREEAVQYYNCLVARVRSLLLEADHGSDPDAARHQLEDIFALKDKGSTFGYLTVVNPPVYAELMQAKLDPASPVDRLDPAHWRGVLAAMLLSEEQESQLILLLQSYAGQIVQRKSEVMQQLADELSQDLLSLELSHDGSSGDIGDELSEEDGGGGGAAGEGADAGGGGPARQPSSSPRAQQVAQAKDELDRLVQLEYWLKFDFTGCVRKLLPAQQQALCMVHSWPFYPDQRQIEAALRERAGPLWDQLARSAA